MPRSYEICGKLLNSFNEREVILFVGAGASMSVNLPNWKNLLEHINQGIKKQLTEEQQGRVDRLFQDAERDPCNTQKLYCEIAEIFKQCNQVLYEEIMYEVFHKKYNGDLLPDYLKLFSRLPVRGIITTNYDCVLEQALGNTWDSFTWQDEDKFHACLRPSKNFIFHLHGRIDKLDSLIHTCTEYCELYEKNDKVKEFSKRLFESNTVLFVGYGLGDPIVPQMKESILDLWGVEPSWYQLVPKSDENSSVKPAGDNSSCNKGKDMPIQLDYCLERNDHITGLNKWFKMLIKQINEYKTIAKFGIMASRQNRNSIPVYGVTQYLRKHQCSYEILDFSGSIGSSRDWIQRQLNSSDAIVVICDTTNTDNNTAWLAEIKRRSSLVQNPIDKTMNIIIYDIYDCCHRGDMPSSVRFASNHQELEESINVIIASKSTQEC